MDEQENYPDNDAVFTARTTYLQALIQARLAYVLANNAQYKANISFGHQYMVDRTTASFKLAISAYQSL